MTVSDKITADSTFPADEVMAAVDLGSNSFHMVVAKFSHGELRIIDRLRETVRLGAGMDGSGRIRPDVADRAIECLERFGHRLRDMHASRVRAGGRRCVVNCSPGSRSGTTVSTCTGPPTSHSPSSITALTPG